MANAIILPSDISPTNVAIVIAQEVSGQWGVAPPCPQNAICLDGIYIARMKRLRTVAGIDVPKQFVANMWLHTHPRNHVVRALLLQRQPSGQWYVFSKADPRKPCFSAELLGKAKLDAAPGAARMNDEICFGSSR